MSKKLLLQSSKTSPTGISTQQRFDLKSLERSNLDEIILLLNFQSTS